MASTYVGEGKVIPWTNGGSAVTVGSVVVIGNLIGIALENIAASAVGSVGIEGVFTVPKVTGTAWVQGESLTYDANVAKFSTPAAITEATGDALLSASAWVAAGSTDATGMARLAGVPVAIQA